MPLSEEQIEHIEELKKELGIDQALGESLSEHTQKRGFAAGISPVSKAQGRSIIEREFNPIIIKVIEELE